MSTRAILYNFGFAFIALVTVFFLFVLMQEESSQNEANQEVSSKEAVKVTTQVIPEEENLPSATPPSAPTGGEADGGGVEEALAYLRQLANLGAAKEEDEEPGIRAVYLTSNSAGSPGMIEYAIDLTHTTQINAVVLDIKDFSGKVAYHDFALKRFHEEGIYVIGRVTVFQDPILANSNPELAVHSAKFLSALQEVDPEAKPSLATVWKDNKGLAWVDPAAKEVWKYNVGIAKNALEKGYEEINFDYIRFPSDGILSDMMFLSWDEETPRREIISSFFAYLREELSGAIISADLFGLSTIKRDGIGIGQVIEDAFENFDYVSPMVYPSHYAKGFLGHENPAEYPYEVIKYSLDSAQARGITNLRPWLQDFDLGADYGEDEVRAEIQAVKDALGEDYVGYMIWAPTNIYTSGALKEKN